MLTGSITLPLPTHRPWSGGVSLVWLPLSTVRWSWNVRPVNPDEPAFEPAIEDAWPGTIRGAFDLLFELGMSRSTSWPASGLSSLWPRLALAA